jgi:hypothetical protein
VTNTLRHWLLARLPARIAPEPVQIVSKHPHIRPAGPGSASGENPTRAFLRPVH